MAADHLGSRLEGTDRLVGMRDEVDWRMNRVLRHGRPTAPAPAKVPRFRSHEPCPLMIPICVELTGGFSKMPPLRTLTRSADTRSCVGSQGAAQDRRGGRLHGALGQNPTL